MNDEQKWSDISNDITNVAKKIKSRIDEEDLVEDLKDTFKNTIENTSQLINNIIQTVESTVTDEEIKKETKEVVSNINAELKNLLHETKNKFSEVFDSDGTYDNSSNYRFTPAVAGKYFVFAGVRFDNQKSQATMRAELKFNGSAVGSNFLAANDSTSNRDYTVTVSCLQTFDDNDYMELFAQSDLSGDQTINGDSTNKTYFGAYKIIGA